MATRIDSPPSAVRAPATSSVPWSAEVDAAEAPFHHSGSPLEPHTRARMRRARRAAFVLASIAVAGVVMIVTGAQLDDTGTREPAQVLLVVGSFAAVWAGWAGGTHGWRAWKASAARALGQPDFTERAARAKIAASGLAELQEPALSRCQVGEVAFGAEARLRPTGRLRVPIVAMIVGGAIGYAPIFLLEDETRFPPADGPSPLLVAWCAVATICGALVAIRWLRLSLVLSPEGVRVPGVLRSRLITWAQVLRVTVRSGRTYVWTLNRKDVRPRAFFYPVLQLADGGEIELRPYGYGTWADEGTRNLAHAFDNLRALDAFIEVHGVQRLPAWIAWCRWAGVASDEG